jgi:hypothetical protein
MSPLPGASETKRGGRCVCCGLAYGPGHHSPGKNIWVVILAEDEKLNDERKITKTEAEENA